MGVFLVEGNKMVEEAVRSDFDIELIVCTDEYARLHAELNSCSAEMIITDDESIAKASLLQNPQEAMAIVRQPVNISGKIDPQQELCLALDFIQDPGNLGTILRIADWFGINAVICSENTVDIYNPKVIQASMGAVFRVETLITSLPDYLSAHTGNTVPIYGTFLEGENIYQQSLSANGIIILGNEGNGISDAVGQKVTHKLLIPDFSTKPNKPESLNVAVAAAICCSEFRRRSIGLFK